MINNKRALYESIMKQVGSVVYNSINEMDWVNIKDKLDKDKRPVARRLGRKVGDYMQSDVYSKNYLQKKYFPKTKEELKEYVDFEIEKQGGVNVDLNMIDTSHITNMSDLFYGCSSLKTLDVSGWDTSNVRFMTDMFFGCSSLKTLDVSGWDTSKVRYMSWLFYDCSSLETLNISDWDTSNVEKMLGMFSGCSSLESLNVSGWNTSNVIWMGSMFEDCTSLEALDVSGWDISNVEFMQYMFSGCSRLKADISMWKLNPNCKTLRMLKGTRNIICTWDNANNLMENKRYSRR